MSMFKYNRIQQRTLKKKHQRTINMGQRHSLHNKCLPINHRVISYKMFGQ